MSTQNGVIIVYTVEGVGTCLIDYVVQEGEIVKIGLADSIMPEGIFALYETMHAQSGHTLRMVSETDEFVIWAVEIGAVDYELCMGIYTHASMLRAGGWV